jgi:ATP-dependent DNA helicase RecG
VTEKSRNQAYSFIEKKVKEGDQAYVVCPLIEESDSLGVTSVQQESEKLAKIFPQAKIEILHGKMKSQEKESIMASFKDGKIDILVATTVIEVGVDVPNATIMVIEGAERFGLSQLHQIRGRVGRGEKQSYCFLFCTDETSSELGRLQRFVQCQDGFQVAELDLQIRGSGEVLGKRQSGQIELQFVDITDTKFIEHVNQVTEKFLKDENLEDYPFLKAHIEQKNRDIHLE